jgi:hypothetical protein
MRGEYSSRNIERACEERVDFMVITGMSHPDFRTIALFRKRHGDALQEMFVQVVKLCKEAKLVDLEHVAIDGTKIKANASMESNKTYKQMKGEEARIAKQVKDWLDKAEAIDAEEDAKYGEDDRGDILPPAQEALRRIREARERLEKRDKEAREKREADTKAGIKPRVAEKKRDQPKEKEKYNFTDEDSRVMKSRGWHFQGYNAQAGVDAKKHIIVSCHVSSKQNDFDELKPALERLRELYGKVKEISLDNGYCSEENLRELESCNIKGYVALGTEAIITKRNNSPNSLRWKMQERLLKGGKRSRYNIRKITVEPVFGIIKHVRKFREFLLRGLSSVTTEWSLVCTSHNLWKLFHAR